MNAIDRLKLKLGIEGDTENDLLNVYLLDAEDAIRLLLNLNNDIEAIDSIFISSQVELARIYYLKGNQKTDVKSESYSEGGVSESITYKTSTEYEEEEKAVLDSLKRYRRVYVKRRKKDITEEA